MNSITINRNKEIKQKITGFYNYKNESYKFLRVQNIDTNLDGVIRFNNKNFEGFNGEKWVLFNSEKGKKGDTGDNYSDKFIFKNTSHSLEDGLIIKNETFIKNENQNDVIETRVLKSGYYNYNNVNLKSIDIKTLENEIILKSNPLPPMIQDYSHLKINDMKSTENDLEFKAYGEVHIYKTKGNIRKGQFVIMDYESESEYFCVKPFYYKEYYDNFINPIYIVGIALEDSLENSLEKIKVCCKGITTIRCNLDPSKINKNCINNNNIEKIGTTALIDMEGYAFSSFVKPSEYYFGGSFLETGKISKNNYLFLIKINF